LQSSGNGTPFAIAIGRRAERDLEAENARWRESHGNAPSKLDADLAEASEALSRHPYLGQRSGPRRKLLLPRTGYFLIYKVRPRKRVVNILGLLHKGHFAPGR